jgi:hypothetical protein
MTQSANSLHALRLVTDRPSLNFANTVDPRESGAMDYLQTYADLAVWAACAGVVSQATASRLVRRARARSVDAGQALRECAAASRGDLSDIFQACHASPCVCGGSRPIARSAPRRAVRRSTRTTWTIVLLATRRPFGINSLEGSPRRCGIAGVQLIGTIEALPGPR